MRNWIFPHTAERDYMRQLLAYVGGFTKTTESRLKELYLLRNDAEGDWSEALAALIIELTASFLRAGETQVLRLPNVFTSISQFNDRQWRLQVKAGTGLEIGPSGTLPFNTVGLGSTSNPQSVRAVFGMGVDVYRSEPWLAALQRNWIAENVNLIKDLPASYLSRVETVVRTGVMQGASIGTISAELQKLEGMTKNRAKLIAADQVGKANAALSEYRMKDLGIKSYIWQTSKDERVRATHMASQGQQYTFVKGSPHVHGLNPGQDIRCLPYESNIEIATSVTKLWRRSNTSKLSCVVTESGKSVKATPKHPVLTNRGWIEIQSVRVGDYLVNTGNQGILTFKNNVKRSDAQIGEIFDTISSYVIPHASSVLGFEFHGDATDGEIETIDIGSFLPDELDSEIGKRICERFLAMADDNIGNSFLNRNGTLPFLVSRLWFSSDSVMRGFCKLVSLLNRETGHSDESRLAAISYFNAALDKASPDGLSIDFVNLGNLKLACSTEIFCNNLINGKMFSIIRQASTLWNNVTVSAERLGEIVGMNADLSSGRLQGIAAGYEFERVTEVFVSEFSVSHVYNLETLPNWYSSDNLIIHNCRCWAEPVFD